MSHQIDLNKYKIRTDLAIDTIKDRKLEGIISKETNYGNIKVTDVSVDKKAVSVIGKKEGRYITLEFDDITDHENSLKVKKIFVSELKKFLDYLNIKKNSKCLIIGLGNQNSTPDALGPMITSKVLITNHLFLLGEIEEGFRPVSAFAPGVMGQTGMETGEVIKSLVKSLKPDFVLVVDALASGSIDRVNKTIQMTDTGIHPGSGVGNNRKEISKETLKIPVIAIGVPTVVDAVTIVSDTINYLYRYFTYTKSNMNNPLNRLSIGEVNYLNKKIDISLEDKQKLFGVVGNLNDSEIKTLIDEVLSPIGYNLMVTPKEIDFIMGKLAYLISNGIDESLHEKVNH